MVFNPGEQTARLTIEVRCPHCGGNDTWMELQRLKKCTFCGSTLYFEQEKSRRFYLDPLVARPDQIRHVLVQQKAAKLRSESMARYPTNPDNPELDIMRMIPVALEPFLLEAEQSIRLLRQRLIFAPYRHLQATFYQTLLAKEQFASYALRRVPVDEALPAYSKDWNFRDRGLKFGEARLKEMTTNVLVEVAHLPEIKEKVHLEETIRNYPPAEGKKFYQFKSHNLCHHRKTLIFRPYWAVEYDFRGTEFALIDATLGSVAGYPDGDEFERFYSYRQHPYASEEVPPVQIISTRCPVCGYDSEWAASEVLHFCKNCGRALALEEGKLRFIPYSFSPTENRSSVQIPFWSFPVQLRYQNRSYSSLSDYYRLFFMERLLKDCQATNHICVPAIEVRQVRKGDEFFSALVAHASSLQKDLLPGPISTSTNILSGHTSPESAAEIISLLLPVVSAVHPGMHKSGALRQMLEETMVDFEPPNLLVLSYPVEGPNVIVGKKRFPLPFINSSLEQT